MKNILVCIILFLSAINVSAQLSEITISYNYHHFNPTGREVCSRMVLLANRKQSKFFNTVNEKVDSMMSTTEGRMAYGQMIRAAMANNDVTNLPIKKEPLYVLKNKTDSVTSVYDLIGADFWTYEEPLLPQEWELTDSTKRILGYDCYKAETTYRGRKWTAWFTPEIPLHDGPWKLCGLPGLILEAIDATGEYAFTADGIELTPTEIRPIYGVSNYEKTERINYLRTMRAFYRNPVANLQAATGSKADSMHATEIELLHDFIETDYHE